MQEREALDPGGGIDELELLDVAEPPGEGRLDLAGAVPFDGAAGNSARRCTSVTIVITPTKPGTLTDTATVKAGNIAAPDSDDSATAATTVTGPPVVLTRGTLALLLGPAGQAKSRRAVQRTLAEAAARQGVVAPVS